MPPWEFGARVTWALRSPSVLAASTPGPDLVLTKMEISCPARIRLHQVARGQVTVILGGDYTEQLLIEFSGTVTASICIPVLGLRNPTRLESRHGSRARHNHTTESHKFLTLSAAVDTRPLAGAASVTFPFTFQVPGECRCSVCDEACRPAASGRLVDDDEVHVDVAYRIEASLLSATPLHASRLARHDVVVVAHEMQGDVATTNEASPASSAPSSRSNTSSEMPSSHLIAPAGLVARGQREPVCPRRAIRIGMHVPAAFRGDELVVVAPERRRNATRIVQLRQYLLWPWCQVMVRMHFALRDHDKCSLHITLHLPDTLNGSLVHARPYIQRMTVRLYQQIHVKAGPSRRYYLAKSQPLLLCATPERLSPHRDLVVRDVFTLPRGTLSSAPDLCCARTQHYVRVKLDFTGLRNTFRFFYPVWAEGARAEPRQAAPL